MTPLTQLLGLTTIVAALVLGDTPPAAGALLALTWLSQALPALRSDEARAE